MSVNLRKIKTVKMAGEPLYYNLTGEGAVRTILDHSYLDFDGTEQRMLRVNAVWQHPGGMLAERAIFAEIPILMGTSKTDIKKVLTAIEAAVRPISLYSVGLEESKTIAKEETEPKKAPKGAKPKPNQKKTPKATPKAKSTPKVAKRTPRAASGKTKPKVAPKVSKGQKK